MQPPLLRRRYVANVSTPPSESRYNNRQFHLLRKTPVMKKPFAALAVLSIAMLSFAQGGGVPAYHPAPPSKVVKLPAILPPEQLWGSQFQHAYTKPAHELAA